MALNWHENRLAYSKHRRTHHISLFWLVMAYVGVFLVCGFLMAGCAVASAHTDQQIVSAIYRAEGGAKAQYQYGIRSVHYVSKKEAKEICIRTVKHARRRFQTIKHKANEDFITFLSKTYCPINAPNDPYRKNVNWVRNVNYFLEKG